MDLRLGIHRSHAYGNLEHRPFLVRELFKLVAHDGHPGTFVRSLRPFKLRLRRVGEDVLNLPPIEPFVILRTRRRYRRHLNVGSFVHLERGAGGRHPLQIEGRIL